VATVEERVAFLEARVEEHARMTDGIREAIMSMDDRLDRRMARLEEKIDLRADAVDARMSRQFLWLVGLHVTTLVAMVGALSGIIAAILGR
jgi:hypothetical protein